MELTKTVTKLLLILAVFVAPVFGQATKTATTENLPWTAIANAKGATGTLQTTSEINVSTSYSAVVHIDWALAEAAAHDGTQIIVMVSSETTADDGWTVLTTILSNAVTPVKTDIAGAEAGGQTELTTGDPTATGLDHPGKLIFIEDLTLAANCEIAYQITDNGANSITVIDGITEAKDAGDDIWTVDAATATGNASVVNTWAITLPPAVRRAKVIFNNWFDETGADGYGRVRTSLLTVL